MNEREEQRILDLLYEDLEDEGSQVALSDEGARELESLRGVLARVREVPDEEPSAHLDALILAQARAQAEKAALEHQPWWRSLLSSRGLSLAMAAATTVFVAVLVVPELERTAQYEPTPEPVPAAAPAAPEPARAALRSAPSARDGVGAAAPADEGGEAEASRRLFKRDFARSAPEADGRRDEDKGARRTRGVVAQGRAAPPRAAEVTTKGDSGGGASAVGALSGGGLGSSAGEDRATREEAKALDDMVSRAKAKKEAKAEAPAEARTLAEAEAAADERANEPTTGRASGPGARRAAEQPPAASPAPPPPAPRPSASAKPSDFADAAEVSGGAAPPAKSAPSSSSASPIETVRTRARALEARGDVDGARRYLLDTRRGYVGTPMYEQVSYELAELELRHRRPAQAEAYARDVLTTKDEALAARARVLIQRARSQNP